MGEMVWNVNLGGIPVFVPPWEGSAHTTADRQDHGGLSTENL